MAKIKIGDRVKIKDRTNWPSPPGYGFANAEGTVVKWIEYDETMEDFTDFVCVHLEKAQGEGTVYIDNNMFFLAENVEKI